MRKIFLAVIALLIVSVQSCLAAEISENRSPFHENVIYPLIKTGDDAIDKKINAAIIAEVDRFITGVYRNAQEINAEVVDVRTNYKIMCNGAGNTVILSVVLTESNYYKGGAHPATYIRPLNFNLSSGELMGLNYLVEVGDGFQDRQLLERLNQKLVEKVERKDIFLFQDALPIKQLPEDFYWDENLHVHFIFQHYAIAPYAMGIIDVDID